MQAYDIIVEKSNETSCETTKTVVAKDESDALLEAGYLPDIGVWFPTVRAVLVRVEINGASILLT